MTTTAETVSGSRVLPGEAAEPGAPLVAEFLVAELAAALGWGTEQGK